MSFVVARAMVKSWIAYWLPRSEGGGRWPPFLLSHVVFPTILCSRSSSMSPHHRPSAHVITVTTCVLSDLRLISMRTLEVVLSGRVDGSDYCTWWTITFRGLCLAMGRRLHDTTDRYRLRATPNQWSYAVSGYRFHFGDLFGSLDLYWHPWSSHGVWVMPAPKCRQSGSNWLRHAIDLFCGGFLGGVMSLAFCMACSFLLRRLLLFT